MHPRSHRRHERGEAKHWLIGCSIAFVVVVIIAVAASLWAIRTAKTWGTDLARGAIVQQIETSSLPDDQKTGIIGSIDRVADDFKAGKMSTEELARIFERISESPVLPIGMAYFAREKYIAPSDLTDEEKIGAERTLQRLARGVFEKQIPESQAKTVMAPLQKTDGNGNQTLKETATNEEVRDFLERAKAAADAAEVPDEPYVVDIAAEIEKAIDETMALPAPPAEEK